MKRTFRWLAIIFSVCLMLFGGATAFAFEAADEARYVGIDVSKWQGTIDYAQVQQAGVQIVYMRAGEGTSYVDPYFDQNYREAKAHGLKVGFYHFVTAQTVEQAQQQARHFAAIIGNRQADCLLVGDFERFDGMSKEQFNQVARAFLHTVEDMTNKKSAIYTSAYSARVDFDTQAAAEFPLWVAEYGASTPEPNGNWDVWVGWQYTNTGRIPGIRGNVDRDHFTQAILLEDTSPIPSPLAPPQEATYYRVVRGDTISAIAQRFDVTVQQLVQWNNLSNPNHIYVGQVLKLTVPYRGQPHPDTTTYTVLRGDTLSALARRFGTTVASLINLNGIPNPNRIYVGEVLRIRAGASEPGDSTYTVRQGDTLSGIANRFHTTVWHLKRLNNIVDADLIFAGQMLELAAGR